MKRVVVVGGGIAGLSLAHALTNRGARSVEAKVLEKSARPGGNVRTEEVDGYLCEWGPNGFLDNVPAMLALVKSLGLEDRLQPSDGAARKRFIYRGGQLHLLPGGPAAFLGSGLLSWTGKLRIGFEPWAASRPEGDETIQAFASRRIGQEAAEVLIDSMVSGIFAGDARQLSLRACFPKMWQLETDHGGLFRALLALRKERRRIGAADSRGTNDPIGAPGGRLTSFRGGTEELIHGLARALCPALETGKRVTRLHEQGGDGARFLVDLEASRPVEADAVVLTGPASDSACILAGMDETLGATLQEIPTAPLAVVCLGYEEASLPRPLAGFGFLVPRGEGPRILGALWDSSLYPGRAPAGRALIRVMVGGARDPKAVDLGDSELLSLVHADLRTTMGLDARPCLVRIVRHHVGIPQYTVGHLARLTRIEERLARHPGLFLAGNSYRGIAMNSCVAEAGPLADRILSSLSPSKGPSPAASR